MDGQTVSVSYDTNYKFGVRGGNTAASYYSSWGPSPSLEIKPEIAAPGGNIFSVGRGEAFSIMSGTSMAAPFISGAAALVKQSVEERGLAVDNIAQFLRLTMMNTAMPVIDTAHNNAIYSVRQVGAGLVDVEAAVKNNVVATYNGKGAIELQDNLSGSVSGTITLKNYGTDAVTYSLGATDVYTAGSDWEYDASFFSYKSYYDTTVAGAGVTFDAESVTVPANGTATVNFTLNLGSAQDQQFVEGYVLFNSADEIVPGLSMPYLGFVGDWDAGTIIDKPEWESDKLVPSISYGYYGPIQYGTGPLSSANGGACMLGEVYKENSSRDGSGTINPDYIAISPNGDGQYDLAVPWLALLRNAETIKMTILDSEGNLVTEVGQVQYVKKITAGDIAAYTHGKSLAGGAYYCAWEGTVYDQATGETNVVPEGQYTVRIQSRVRENGDCQTIDMPLAVDLTAPEFTSFQASLGSNGRYVEVTYSAADAHGILDELAFAFNGQVDMITNQRHPGDPDPECGVALGWTYDSASNTYSGKIKVPSNLWNAKELHFSFMISDNAGNTSMKSVQLKGGTDGSEPDVKLLNLPADRTVFTNRTSYTVFGIAPTDSTVTFTVNDSEETVTAAFPGAEPYFRAVLPLNEGENTVSVSIVRGSETLLTAAAKIRCNSEPIASAPLIVNDAVAINEGSIFILNNEAKAGTAASAVQYLDNAESWIFSVTDSKNGTAVSTVVNANSYTFDIPLYDYADEETGEASGAYGKVTYYMEDAYGIYSMREILVLTPAAAAAAGYAAVPCNTSELLNVGFSITVTTEECEDGVFTVRGQAFNPITKVLVNGQEATVDPVTGRIWSCDIQLTKGRNFVVVDTYVEGCETAGASGTARIFYDDAPVLELTNLPEDYFRGAYYVDDADFTLKGAVTTRQDDATIFINNEMIECPPDAAHSYGEEFTTRSFSYDLHFENGDNYVTIVVAGFSGMYVTEELHFILGEHEACTHTNTTVENAKEATCTEPGYSGDRICSDCGETVENGSNVPALGHSWGDWSVTKNPDYGVVGEKTRTCERCGETETEEIDALEKPEPSVPGVSIPTQPHDPIKPDAGKQNSFTDVPANAWFADAVNWAVNSGITTGTSATTFSPNAACTRAQAVTFLWRAAGSPAPESRTNPFTDVKPGDYYYDAVLWAVEQKITNGTSATTFSPDADCTRAQIVTFLWRSQGAPKVASANPFVDVAADAYYAEAVLWAVKNGITNGTSEAEFSSGADCTRAQIVTFLYRASEHAGN